MGGPTDGFTSRSAGRDSNHRRGRRRHRRLRPAYGGVPHAGPPASRQDAHRRSVDRGVRGRKRYPAALLRQNLLRGAEVGVVRCMSKASCLTAVRRARLSEPALQSCWLRQGQGHLEHFTLDGSAVGENGLLDQVGVRGPRHPTSGGDGVRVGPARPSGRAPLAMPASTGSSTRIRSASTASLCRQSGMPSTL